MITTIRFALCGTLVLALSVNSARAGEITGFTWFSGVASVAAAPVVPASVPNNDDVAGPSPNTIWVTQKDYEAIGPVDLVFNVSASGGTTEYLFIEGVFNDTGTLWTGYHLELGFGHGTGFVKSSFSDDLDFDAPDYNSPLNFNPSPGFFPSVSASTDDILAGGGVMPNFSFAGYFRFAVDVPDGIKEFTVRQSPIGVPEPSTWILALAGFCGVCCLRRRCRLTIIRKECA